MVDINIIFIAMFDFQLCFLGKWGLVTEWEEETLYSQCSLKKLMPGTKTPRVPVKCVGSMKLLGFTDWSDLLPSPF